MAKTKRRDKEATKKKLLDAAVEVFSRQGYDAATTKAVASVAGINEALIQRYFEGKAGLLLAVLSSFECQEEKAACAMLEPSETLAKDIEVYLRGLLDHTLENEGFLRVGVSRSIVDPKIGSLLRKRVLEDRVPLLVERLRFYQKRGEINKGEDLEAIAFTLSVLGFVLGFMGQVVFKIEPKRMNQIAGRVAKVFAKGLS